METKDRQLISQSGTKCSTGCLESGTTSISNSTNGSYGLF